MHGCLKSNEAPGNFLGIPATVLIIRGVAGFALVYYTYGYIVIIEHG